MEVLIETSGTSIENNSFLCIFQKRVSSISEFEAPYGWMDGCTIAITGAP